ncbi:hypothetical protein ACQKL5_02210 [Peribacillus sp. NPDC097675]|uniref:hypothetical protein n=1 Tax=Peribacillus sp. NPDC097675 TaxID=3390618 RepID=UPI003D080BC7
MDKKIECLKDIKEDVGVDLYRKAVTKVVASYYSKVLSNRGKKVKRTEVWERTNIKLKELGIEEVSYEFMRTVV